MAYTTIPTRTSADANSAADINALNNNIERTYGGSTVVTVSQTGGADYSTISSALAAITDASASKRYTIHVVDDSSYAVDFACKSYVDIYAPFAEFTFAGGAQIVLNSEVNITVKRLHRTSGGNAAILNSTGTGKSSLTVLEEAIDEGTANFIRDTLSSCLMYYNIRTARKRGAGEFYGGYATGNDHAHLRIGDLYLEADNAVGILRNSGTGSIVADIQHVIDTGYTGTTAFDVDSGELSVICHEVLADTVYDVASGATLRITCADITGIKTVNAGGTIYETPSSTGAAVNGNLPAFDANRDLVDSGIYISDIFDLTQASRISGTSGFAVNNEAYCRFERGSDGIWVMELWVEYTHSPGAGGATDITLSGITARVSQPLVVQPSGAGTTSSAIITDGNNVINVDYGAVNVAGQLWGRIQLESKPSGTYYSLPN